MSYSPSSLALRLWSNMQVQDQLQVSQGELSVGKEGLITDRYTAAVVNLGDDAIDVRLGGIYALQRIMEDSPRDQPTVANVLTAYGGPSRRSGDPEEGHPPSED
ncbi:hypothetical protein [Streptomyces lunaelactis]|uniref:hypothetical protein n=1 Tax=Streptomyces lunaelactis TaxID=1535768 RepID=UPI0020C7E16E|nr:hypothetical protein [Streptomyces lunaelactis]